VYGKVHAVTDVSIITIQWNSSDVKKLLIYWRVKLF